MNKEVNLDLKIFKDLYNSFKDFLIPIAIICISFLLFIFIILPQAQTVINNQSLQKEESKKIAVMAQNFQLLSNLDESTLNTQVLAVTKALPPQKDFAGIIGALTTSANNSGVSLGDFQLQVGDLNQGSGGTSAVPNIEITINLQTDVNGLVTFLDELKKNDPISTVSSFKSGVGFSTVKIAFYFRPLPQVSFNDTSQIFSLNSADLQVLSSLPAPVAIDTSNLQPATSSGNESRTSPFQ